MADEGWWDRKAVQYSTAAPLMQRRASRQARYLQQCSIGEEKVDRWAGHHAAGPAAVLLTLLSAHLASRPAVVRFKMDEAASAECSTAPPHQKRVLLCLILS